MAKYNKQKDVLISLDDMGLYTTLMKAYIEKKVPWVGTKQQYLELVEEGYNFEGRVIIFTDEYETSFNEIETKIQNIQQLIGAIPESSGANTVIQYVDYKTDVAKTSDIVSLFSK